MQSSSQNPGGILDKKIRTSDDLSGRHYTRRTKRMANKIRNKEMATCPQCGATIAKNLAERIKSQSPADGDYICPGTKTYK